MGGEPKAIGLTVLKRVRAKDKSHRCAIDEFYGVFAHFFHLKQQKFYIFILVWHCVFVVLPASYINGLVNWIERTAKYI